MGRNWSVAWQLTAHCLLQAALWCTTTAALAGQAHQEGKLHAAVAAEPGDLHRYLELADFYRVHDRIEAADRTLRDAIYVDPANPVVHERRVSLFAKPFDPARVARIAQEWLSVDATSPVPVLLSVGDRLRRASGLRGDGTRAAEEEIQAGLEAVQGALPSHPDRPSLLLARARLLEARAALATDRSEKERSLAEAWAMHQRAKSIEAADGGEPQAPSPLTNIVQAMLQPVPFGPPGAVRAETVVPMPKRLTQARIPASRIPAGARPRGLALELVVDTHGHVVQIHPLDSKEGYDAAVADEVKRWVYEPTRLHGELVSVIVTVWLPTRR